MPNLPWLQSFMANANEQKYSVMIASVAAVAIASIVIWSTFFHEEQVESSPLKKTLSVQVAQKPQLPKDTTIPSPATARATASKPKQVVLHKQLVIGQGNLYVQVAAFKQPNLARLSFEKMTAQYKHAKIINRSGLHMVWVGPVITKKDAEILKKHIQRRNNIRGFIVSEK